jgi:hypothetical protein
LFCICAGAPSGARVYRDEGLTRARAAPISRGDASREGSHFQMTDTDKIVAAILAAAQSIKEGGDVNEAHLVDSYKKMLFEISLRENAEAGGLARALEESARLKKSSNAPRS